MSYLILLIAIIAEIIGTTFLKISDGMTKTIPSIVVILAYSLSFWSLSQTLKIMPMGIVYAVWSGIGILGIALVGHFFFSEGFGIWHLTGTTLIILGSIILLLIV